MSTCEHELEKDDHFFLSFDHLSSSSVDQAALMMVAWEGQAGKWGDGHLGELGLEELEKIVELGGLQEF